MRKFKKNPAVRLVVLPTHGRVYDYDILEGDEYAQYCPSLLVEIEEPVLVEAPVQVIKVQEVAAPVAVEVKPADLAAVAEEPTDVNSPPVEVAATIATTDEVAAPVEKRKRGRPKKAQ